MRTALSSEDRASEIRLKQLQVLLERPFVKWIQSLAPRVPSGSCGFTDAALSLALVREEGGGEGGREGGERGRGENQIYNQHRKHK